MFHFSRALEGDSAANDMGRCGSEARGHSAATEGARGAGVVVGGASELVVGKKKCKHCLAEALGDKIG